MSVLESYIVEQVCKHAKAAGWIVRKMMYQNRIGCPDQFCFGPGGRLIIIEFKAPGKKPMPHQQREIERLRDQGFEVHVIDDIEKGKALFD